jgi:histidinol-phosphate aminotransferase
MTRGRSRLSGLGGYHSPQVPADVRLNTNESPYPPPAAWQEDLAAAVAELEFHRYPDREAAALRQGIASLHGVASDEVFCANGSNEVLQCLLLAYGGPGRRALVFEPTYALHAHIARLTSTGVVTGRRTADFRIEPDVAVRLAAEELPDVAFVCSPNNPTGRLEDPAVVELLLGAVPGLVVVDEAYGQFSRWSALELRHGGVTGSDGLVVVRTFSKTWAMAAARLGYLVADAEVVAGCEAAALPYHLSAQTQAAGVLALRYRDEMARRVALVAAERDRLAAGVAGLPVESWPSDANFVLFRPRERDAPAVWKELLSAGVLVRDVSTRPGLAGCLRVTVGTPEENDRFLDALARSLA